MTEKHVYWANTFVWWRWWPHHYRSRGWIDRHYPCIHSDHCKLWKVFGFTRFTRNLGKEGRILPIMLLEYRGIDRNKAMTKGRHPTTIRIRIRVLSGPFDVWFSFLIDGTFLYFHFPPCFASAAPRSRSDIFCSFPAIAAQLRDRSHENYPVCQKMTFSERKKHPLFVTVNPIYRYKTYYPGYFHNNIALLTLFHIVTSIDWSVEQILFHMFLCTS